MPKFRLRQTQIDELLVYLKSLNPCARPSSDTEAMNRCFEPL
jgi:cytochrome c